MEVTFTLPTLTEMPVWGWWVVGVAGYFLGSLVSCRHFYRDCMRGTTKEQLTEDENAMMATLWFLWPIIVVGFIGCYSFYQLIKFKNKPD